MNRHGYIGRKVQHPKLHEQPAIIIVSFGSTSERGVALQLFDKALCDRYPEHRIIWAYTSAIIRKKTGNLSLHQALALAEAENFRKVVVQPLHIFAGTEYQQMEETCEYFPGLRVLLGAPLMQRWEQIKDLLSVVEGKFLAENEGLNIVALHGTPNAANPANTVYLGLDNLIRGRYSNVLAAAIEGVPDFDNLQRELKLNGATKKWTRVRLIPFLYMAGMHVEKDLMGKTGWQKDLLEIGFDSVECLTTNCQTDQGEQKFFMGLGYYPEVIEMYLDRLERALTLIKFH